MIPRYAKPEMESIWTDDNKFKIMLEVEILASEAMSKLGVVPKSAIDKVYAVIPKVTFDKMHYRKDIAQRALKWINK